LSPRPGSPGRRRCHNSIAGLKRPQIILRISLLTRSVLYAISSVRWDWLFFGPVTFHESLKAIIGLNY
jgi:hypothetical protein